MFFSGRCRERSARSEAMRLRGDAIARAMSVGIKIFIEHAPLQLHRLHQAQERIAAVFISYISPISLSDLPTRNSLPGACAIDEIIFIEVRNIFFDARQVTIRLLCSSTMTPTPPVCTHSGKKVYIGASELVDGAISKCRSTSGGRSFTSASASSYSFSAPTTGAKWLIIVETPVSRASLIVSSTDSFMPAASSAQVRGVHAVIFFYRLRERAQFRVWRLARVHITSPVESPNAPSASAVSSVRTNTFSSLGEIADRVAHDRAADRGVADERAEFTPVGRLSITAKNSAIVCQLTLTRSGSPHFWMDSSVP